MEVGLGPGHIVLDGYQGATVDHLQEYNTRTVRIHHGKNNIRVQYTYVKMQLQSWKNFLISPITRWRGSATGRALDLRSIDREFKFYWRQRCVTTLGKLFTPMFLCHQAV